MDLLQSVRKEGSRGGRADFKWEDVKADSQRENYMGHSIMAPVGRWQKGRDLNWYAKGDSSDAQSTAARLAEEKRKVKEAEEDAMLVAMGLPVPQRASTNANMVPLGEKASEADVKKAMAEVKAEEADTELVKGVRFGGYNGRYGVDGGDEVLKGEGMDNAGLVPRKGRERDAAPRERRRDRKDDDGDKHKRRRSRSRSRDHHRRRRSRSRDRDRERRKHRSRSHERRRDEDYNRRRRRDPDVERPRSRSRDRVRDRRPRRSRSPYDSADRQRRR